MPYYNQIQEIGNNYVIWKNPDLVSTGTIPFKNMFVDWGHDQLLNRVKIRSLIYPRDSYSLEKVQQIAQETISCPNCIEGKPLSLNISETNINNNNNKKKSDYHNMPFGMSFKKINPQGISLSAPIDKMIPSGIISDKSKFVQQAVGQVIGQLIGMGTAAAIPEKIMQKVVNFLIGLGVTIGNEAGMTPSRLKDELRIIGISLLTSVLDPITDAKDLARMQQEASAIVGRLRFGNPLDILKMSFAGPLDNMINQINNMVRGLSMGGGDLLSLGSNVINNPQLTKIVPTQFRQTSRLTDYTPPGNTISGFRIQKTIN